MLIHAVSHGTRSAAARTAITGLVEAVAAALPGDELREAFVDVQQPAIGDALRQDAGECVVVPLLLSAGYHLYTDLVAATRNRPGARLAAALGPDARMVEVLAARVTAAGPGPVVLACAGSSDPRAIADCDQTAVALAERLGRPVRPAYLSAAQPTPGQAVAEAGEGAIVLPYLLAPGYLHSRLDAVPATVLDPLCRPDRAPDPLLVEVVISRIRAALQQVP
ncbi:sirohydrochlorin chelatase [Granulicoccus phenolivorans]|uniref:sirohydrochlorin chelatase n=1 Tax=Granulicoccus phenolivorans TaxID=266854 RepID=UPI00040D41C4|nr:CbiX/SirB N-terminal domain-containing protein [Granulicoccus phenolivorans]